MSLKLYIEPYNNNNWTDTLIKYIPHTEVNIEECDYIVSSKIPYGSIDSLYIQDSLLSYSDFKKPVIVFLYSDFNEPMDIPPNVILFRSGLYKSQWHTNEHIIPYVYMKDDLKQDVEFKPFPKRGIHPIVGFSEKR